MMNTDLLHHVHEPKVLKNVHVRGGLLLTGLCTMALPCRKLSYMNSQDRLVTRDMHGHPEEDACS